jgi:hypothetical protein
VVFASKHDSSWTASAAPTFLFRDKRSLARYRIHALRMPLNTMAHADNLTWQPHDGLSHPSLARSRRPPGRLQHYSQILFRYILHLRPLVWAFLPPRASTLAVLRLENSPSCLPCNWALHASALLDTHRQMRRTAPHGVPRYILSAASYLKSSSLQPVQPRASNKGRIYSHLGTLALGGPSLNKLSTASSAIVSYSYAVRLRPSRRTTSCASEVLTPPSGESFAAMQLISN